MIAVLRYTYPPRCQVAKGSAPIVVRSDRREEKAHYQPKMILRPKVSAVTTSRVGHTQIINTFSTCCSLPTCKSAHV